MINSKINDLNLSLEESRDIIEFLARRRNVSNYEHMTNEELLSTLKKTPYSPPQKPPKLGKRKNNQILTTQPPRKMVKLDVNQNLTLHKPIKIAKRRKTQNLIPQKSLKLGKRKNTPNLTIQKPSKIAKLEINQNLTPQKQIKSKNKERIEVIREQLRELAYKLSKSELKEIKKRLYMLENKKGLLESKKPRKCLDELDKKIRQLEKYYHDDDFEFRGIRNIQDLFKLPIDEDYYKPALVKSGYNSNYTQYESKGDKILTVK